MKGSILFLTLALACTFTRSTVQAQLNTEELSLKISKAIQHLLWVARS